MAANPLGLNYRLTDKIDSYNSNDQSNDINELLDESVDALNDVTFGGSSNDNSPIGCDFDFSGQTARVLGISQPTQSTSNSSPALASALSATNHDHHSYASGNHASPHFHRNPISQSYVKETSTIPHLEVDADLWGIPCKTPTFFRRTPSEEPKMLSVTQLEEMMHAQIAHQLPNTTTTTNSSFPFNLGPTSGVDSSFPHRQSGVSPNARPLYTNRQSNACSVVNLAVPSTTEAAEVNISHHETPQNLDGTRYNFANLHPNTANTNDILMKNLHANLESNSQPALLNHSTQSPLYHLPNNATFEGQQNYFTSRKHNYGIYQSRSPYVSPKIHPHVVYQPQDVGDSISRPPRNFASNHTSLIELETVSQLTSTLQQPQQQPHQQSPYETLRPSTNQLSSAIQRYGVRQASSSYANNSLVYTSRGQVNTPPNNQRITLQQRYHTRGSDCGPYREQSSRNHPTYGPNNLGHGQHSRDQSERNYGGGRRGPRGHYRVAGRYSGLMTVQDKNYIFRVQLKQLVSVVGGIELIDDEYVFRDDFYFRAFWRNRRLRSEAGASSDTGYPENSNFPLKDELSWKDYFHSSFMRMEQQVVRAVEAAKARPKNSQISFQGSLGTVAFSNAKTPKLMLTIKPDMFNIRYEKGKDIESYSCSQMWALNKVCLARLESVYSILIELDDHEQLLPNKLAKPLPEALTDEGTNELWNRQLLLLNGRLYDKLGLGEGNDQKGSGSIHPFIHLLSRPKGVMALPRIFRHTFDVQKLKILSLIVSQFEKLRVVYYGLPNQKNRLPAKLRRDISHFCRVILPHLFVLVSGLTLPVLVGLLSIFVGENNISRVVCTRVGQEVLTMFISRAEVLKESLVNTTVTENNTGDNSETVLVDLAAYREIFNDLFIALESSLPSIFWDSPSPHTKDCKDEHDDMHTWQFLAAVGVAASPDQQQRLVIGVKDHVMRIVQAARQMPGDEGFPILQKVNLFLRGLGFDVDML